MVRGALLLLAVELGGGFGTASATVLSGDDLSMVVELHVTTEVRVESMVAHLSLPGRPLLTIPLIPEGEGSFRITTELPRGDYQVVLEAVGVGLSDPVSLSAMGAQLSEPVSTTSLPAGIDPETRGWMWLSIAFAAAALSALAFWALGGDAQDGAISPD